MLKRTFASFAFSLVTLLAIATSGYAQALDLITNGDFYGGTTTGWSPTYLPTNVGSVFVTSTTPNGDCLVGDVGALHVQANNAEAWVDQAFSVVGGGLYRFNFQHRTSHTSGMIATVTIDDGVASPPTTHTLTLSNSSAVDHYEYFTASPTSTSVTITFYVKSTVGGFGARNLFFDNVSFIYMR